VARITVVDAAAFADTAAARIVQLVRDAIGARGVAYVSLTGGSTPRDTYEALADSTRGWRERIDWSRVQLFWGDERHVPPDHPDSNYGMAYRALVHEVAIPPAQVHRIHAELADAHDAAAAYALQLPETFDVMLLGLGEDCHIASLFPGSELLQSASPQRVRAVLATHLNTWRITVTPEVILASREIVMLVSGETKAPAVATAIEGPFDVGQNPGQLLRQAGDRVEWILDREAASRLRGW